MTVQEKKNKYNQIYYKRHKEEISKKASEKYKKNKEAYKERTKKYRKNNVDKVKERNKRWYTENKDECLKKSQEYYSNNLEKVKVRHKEYERVNRDKFNKATKKWRVTNPDKSALSFRKQTLRKYGLTPESYSEMMLGQGNKCKICGNTFSDKSLITKPAVDHCHKTSKIRGILCGRCNLAIGNFNDSVELLKKAIQYLKETT